MLIYRIEHPVNGNGPYKQTKENAPRNEYGESINNVHGGDPTHPAPFSDFGHMIMWYEKCGFESIDKLLVWFESEWIDILHDLGYLLCIYEVPDLCVHIGNFQVVYDHDKAVLIHKERL